MQFDWTTFALEMLNFLVLLWILKRFLYQPVLAVLDARQQAMRDQADRADAVRREADALKVQYDARLADWKQEREQAWQTLEQELERNRSAALDALKKQIIDEKDKAQLHEKASAAAREAALARQAKIAAYEKVAAMLQRLASVDLTRHIVTLFEEDLRALPEEQRAALREAAAALEPHAVVEVASAHPLDESVRQRITQALSDIAARPLLPSFKAQPALMAGVRVGLGQCLLQANLSDELAFFREHDLHA
jgi:F-type H+-transporting ATPase subunit b